jgi:hypothetical protein
VYTISATHVAPAGDGAGGDTIAQPSAQWGQTAVLVDTDDVTGAVVTLQPGGTIRGRVTVDSGQPRPASRPAFDDMRVIVEPGVWRQEARTRPRPVDVSVSAAGDFVAGPFLPGAYFVRVSFASLSPSDNWYYAGIASAGAGVMPRSLDVANDVLVDLVVSTRFGRVQGPVREPVARQSWDESSVVVFPVDEQSWPVARWNRMHARQVYLSTSGDYEFELPPGDYHLVAMSAQDLGAWWTEPSFLARLARVSERITIAAGETRTVSLSVRPAP